MNTIENLKLRAINHLTVVLNNYIENQNPAGSHYSENIRHMQSRTRDRQLKILQANSIEEFRMLFKQWHFNDRTIDNLFPLEVPYHIFEKWLEGQSLLELALIHKDFNVDQIEESFRRHAGTVLDDYEEVVLHYKDQLVRWFDQEPPSKEHLHNTLLFRQQILELLNQAYESHTDLALDRMVYIFEKFKNTDWVDSKERKERLAFIVKQLKLECGFTPDFKILD